MIGLAERYHIIALNRYRLFAAEVNGSCGLQAGGGQQHVTGLRLQLLEKSIGIVLLDQLSQRPYAKYTVGRKKTVAYIIGLDYVVGLIRAPVLVPISRSKLRPGLC